VNVRVVPEFIGGVWLTAARALDGSIAPVPKGFVFMVRQQDLETTVLLAPEIRDLAPGIHRQRLVIEGTCQAPIDDENVCGYLRALSDECDMTLLTEPVTHRSQLYGWAGWIHWETSGAHLYAWDDPLFFSVDIYTCKAFDPGAVVRFTADYFDALEIVSFSF
jgi:S-adenosylmethionine decarboxylase